MGEFKTSQTHLCEEEYQDVIEYYQKVENKSALMRRALVFYIRHLEIPAKKAGLPPPQSPETAIRILMKELDQVSALAQITDGVDRVEVVEKLVQYGMSLEEVPAVEEGNHEELVQENTELDMKNALRGMFGKKSI